jgi:hypothetical protein
MDGVRSCKTCSKMDDHGLSCLLKGHDDYGLWHAIRGHMSSMHSMEEVERNCWKEKVGYTCFQGVHGRLCANKLECCSHCLWDWRSYDQDGWHIINTFFSLGLSNWTDTPSRWSHQSSMIDIKPFIMNIKKPCP